MWEHDFFKTYEFCSSKHSGCLPLDTHITDTACGTNLFPHHADSLMQASGMGFRQAAEVVLHLRNTEERAES